MTEFGTTRTIVVFGIVVACFAVLWPKLFYPIFFAGNGGGKDKSTNIRQERSNSLHDGYLHPAFKEKGSAYYAGGGNEKPPPPVRTIDKELKPGPVPGMRPAFGGGMNHIPQQKGAGSMGILMPLYTIGISVFFLYTITKVLFKKKDTENHQSHFQRDRSAIEETLERSKREVLDSSPFHRKYEPPCVTPPPPKQLANGSDAVLSKGSPTFRENAKLESQAEAGKAPVPTIPVSVQFARECSSVPDSPEFESVNTVAILDDLENLIPECEVPNLIIPDTIQTQLWEGFPSDAKRDLSSDMRVCNVDDCSLRTVQVNSVVKGSDRGSKHYETTLVQWQINKVQEEISETINTIRRGLDIDKLDKLDVCVNKLKNLQNLRDE